ncbi:avt5, partial [Symbiodinium pilosum]
VFEVESEPTQARERRRSLALDTDGSFISCEGGGPNAAGGSVFSAYVNAANTILGAGTLAVPIAMSSAGLLSYELITVLVVAVNFTTVHWLTIVADHLPKGTPRNYEGIARRYLGSAASHVISLVFIFGGLSLGMSYMLFTAGSMAPVLASYMASEGEEPEEKEVERLAQRLLWGVGLCVVLPLGMLRDISKLKFTSSVAIIVLGYAAGFIVFCNVGALLEKPAAGEGFQLVNVSSDFFLSLAMTTSNFSCHVSAIPIYESLGSRGATSIRKVLLLALGTAALLYQIVGLSSYLRFGHLESGGSNILEVVAASISVGQSPVRFALVSLASAGVAFNLAFSMPMAMWALRSVILSYYQAACAMQARRAGLPEVEVLEIENGEPSMLEWCMATTLLMLSILTLATLVPNIQVIMSLGGSLGGTFIAFMYPALFRLTVVKGVRSSRDLLQHKNAAELGVIAMSIVYGVLCLSISIRKVVLEFQAAEPSVTATTSTLTLTTTALIYELEM